MHSRTTCIINWTENSCPLTRKLEPVVEKGQKLDKNEANRQNERDQVGTKARHRTGPGQFEGKRAVVSQIVSALFRAYCVAVLVALPALLLPTVASDTAQIVVVIALLAALLTFMEYYGKYPSIVEFRFAPPFNRIKFIALAVAIITISLIMRGKTDPNGLTEVLAMTGDALGRVIDFPYSPVRLVILMLPPDAGPGLVGDVRTAAGISYAVSLVMMLVFVTYVRMLNWPMRKGSFNVWVNLPLFDPTRGGDVVDRLKRDAGVNIVLGALLPFIIPTAIKATSDIIDPVSVANPQTLIWTITAWAFLPASMLIRGIALSRVAELIEAKRRRVYGKDGADGLQEA